MEVETKDEKIVMYTIVVGEDESIVYDVTLRGASEHEVCRFRDEVLRHPFNPPGVVRIHTDAVELSITSSPRGETQERSIL